MHTIRVILSAGLLICTISAMATVPADSMSATASQTTGSQQLSRLASGQLQQVPSPRKPQIPDERPQQTSRASRPTTDKAAIAASGAAEQKAQRTVRKPALPKKTQ